MLAVIDHAAAVAHLGALEQRLQGGHDGCAVLRRLVNVLGMAQQNGFELVQGARAA